MKKIFLILAFACIMSGCACHEQTDEPEQQKKNIFPDDFTAAYLGPEGTYSHEACNLFFAGQGRCIPADSVKSAVESVSEGRHLFAVVPLENTVGGAVTDYVDTLIAHPELSVAGEVVLPIRQNLLALPQTELAAIRKVYSHPQGLIQGRAWLELHLPDAELIEVSSTAAGVKAVAEGKDPAAAAVASAACADVYGVKILARSIQLNDSNKTRFYILSADRADTAVSQRLAFTASGSAAELPLLMARMQQMNIRLETIHERPLKTELGMYHYLIECSSCSYETYQKLTEGSRFNFRYLGNFPVR